MIQAEVTKTGTENALSTIRRFTRRVQGANIVKSIRNKRYYSRATSGTVKKKRALKLLKRRADFAQLLKEGKVAEKVDRRGHAIRPQPTQTAASDAAAKEAPTTQGKMEGTPIAR